MNHGLLFDEANLFQTKFDYSSANTSCFNNAPDINTHK